MIFTLGKKKDPKQVFVEFSKNVEEEVINVCGTCCGVSTLLMIITNAMAGKKLDHT